MPLDQYENFEEIKESTSPERGQVFSDLDLDLLIYDIENVDLPKGLEDVKLEMHVYAPPPGTQYIGGVYDVRDILDDDTSLDIGLVKAFETLDIRRGQFKVAFNYLRNHIGDYYNRDLYVVEVAPDRDEIHLRFVEYQDQPTPIFTSDLIAQINNINKRYSVNFGENELYRIINAKGDENDLYLKIYGTFDETTVEEKQRVYLVEELIQPYIDNVNILPPATDDAFNTLRGPNWEVETGYGTVTETDFKTWNDLLDTNLSTSQQIIDRYFSGSLQGADLNIDFTNFKNFVHYSAATERLLNFRYKLQLIEHYDAQIGTLSAASGSDSGSIVGNIGVNRQRKDNVVGSFDLFERWLYNEPTSSLTTHGISGSAIFAENYTLQPWPKYLSNGVYVNHHTTSSLGTSWYTGFSSTASLYDLSNDDSLTKTIPEHIRNDANNDQYDLFVNMIGQHFDILWTYVNALATNLYTREEHPKLGMSADLLKPMAESMGWQLTNGKQAEQLWQYKLGLTQSGSYQSTGSLFSKSGESITHEVWRRIVNNLPYLLKTKGTTRGIKALMNAYGVPQTLLSIREYGGPKVANDTPALIEDRFVYALDCEHEQAIFNGRVLMDWEPIVNSNVTNYQSVPWTQELRFRTQFSNDSFVSYTYPMGLLGRTPNTGYAGSGWGVRIQQASESISGSYNYGQAVFMITGSGGLVSASTPMIPLFDGDFWNLRLQTGEQASYDTATDISQTGQSWHLKVQKAADHAVARITHQASASLYLSTNTNMTGSNSASYNLSWRSGSSNQFGNLRIGARTGVDGTYGYFSGSVQEYRQYAEKINDTTFDLHTFNPTSYVGNNETSSYDTLVRHYVFGTDGQAINHELYPVVTSSHPNQTILDFDNSTLGTFASASYYANGNDYSNYTETYYIDAPSLGGNNFRSQKIRLDNNRLVNVLSPENTAQRSRFENAPIDSERLGLFYSAADQYNKEIFNHIGPVELDDYIGDPNDQFEMSYPDLSRFAQQYWKKYTDRNDINDYIRVFSLYDFSLFEQIKQMLPARVIPSVGLLVEPNVLERSKVLLNDKPTVEQPAYSAIIDDKEPVAISEYILYSGSISPVADLVNASTVFHISASGYNDVPGTFTAEFSGSDPFAPMSYTMTEALYTASSTGYYNNEIEIPATCSIIETPRASEIFLQVARDYNPNQAFRQYPLDRYINGRAHDLSLNTEHAIGNKRVLNDTTGSTANQLDITTGYFDTFLLTSASNNSTNNFKPWSAAGQIPRNSFGASFLDSKYVQASVENGPTSWLEVKFRAHHAFGSSSLIHSNVSQSRAGYFTYNNETHIDIENIRPDPINPYANTSIPYIFRLIYATSSAELTSRASTGNYQFEFTSSITGSTGVSYSTNFPSFANNIVASGSRLSRKLSNFNQSKDLFIGLQVTASAGYPLATGVKIDQVKLSDVQVDPFPTEAVNFNFYSGNLTRVSASVSSSHPNYNGREFVDLRDISFPTSGPSGSWSLSWLAQEDVGHTGSLRTMFGADNDYNPAIEFTLNNKLAVRPNNPGTFPYAEIDATIDREALNHYIIVYNGGEVDDAIPNVKLWVNSEYQGIGNLSSAQQFTLGCIGSGQNASIGTHGFAGLIGRVQIYDGIRLSQSEIERLWQYPHHRIIRDPHARIQASNINLDIVVSRSLETAGYNDDFFTQTDNLYYNGCRITSADINVPTTQTPDNSAVVTVFETNPNQIIYSQNARNGNLRIR